MCEDDEISDPNYQLNLSDSLMRKQAYTQSIVLHHFKTRWKQEYLTSLREFHRTTGNNMQRISTEDVVLIHDDAPRLDGH